jgi:hypothetical protein
MKLCPEVCFVHISQTKLNRQHPCCGLAPTLVQGAKCLLSYGDWKIFVIFLVECAAVLSQGCSLLFFF